MQNIYDVIISRRSQRRYTKEMPSRAVIEKIIDAARWAPSAGNRQNLYWWVATGKIRNELVKIINQVSDRAADIFKDYEEKVQRFLTLYFRTLGGAPVIITLSFERKDDKDKDEHFDWDLWDYASGCAAMQNFILLAHAEGLGTCWMTAPLLVHEEIKKCLSIPENHDIVAVTPLGYSQHEIPPIPRVDADLKKTVKWYGFDPK
jgi:nitroreductase